MIKTTSFAAMVICTCVTLGCGDGGRGEAVLKRRANLSKIGLAYHGYYHANGKSAANASQLAQYMASESATDPQVTEAIRSLEEGDIVIIWDGVLADSAENARHVLGFEAGVPATGGYVVMGDAEVRLMTGKEFAQATMLPTSTDPG